jgi:hypothetical protein
LHGTDLLFSALIGYIENETTDYWFTQINYWIEERHTNDSIFWGENENLSESTLDCFKSVHKRIDCNMSELINLFHFFHLIN